jgi:hypothetical protein
MALHERLALDALADAGLELRDVDAILTLAPRSDSYLIHAAAFAEYLGIAPPIALTLEGGGAAPAIMVDMARNMIEGGSARTVLIVSADMPLSVNTRDSYVNTLADSGPVHPFLRYLPWSPALTWTALAPMNAILVRSPCMTAPPPLFIPSRICELRWISQPIAPAI